MLYFFALYTTVMIMVDGCWLVANHTGRGDREEKKTRGKALQFKHNLNNGIQ